MKKFILSTLVGAGLAATALPSYGVTYLGLGIDGSGSINDPDGAGPLPHNFDLQVDGYVNALTNLPVNNDLQIGIWQFSNTVNLEIGFTVFDATGKAALIAALNLMTQIGSTTDIAGAIDTITDAIVAAGATAADDGIIDISTDGVQVPADSGNPAASALAALALGGGGIVDQVNGIGVGAGANLSWVPAGSLTFTANSFADFDAAIEEKIRTEVGLPDGGSTVLLLGSVLLGFFGTRKFSRKAA